MTKEELALEVVDRLKKEYPDVGCTLDYDQAWKLLVSVRLAAQCTDARVNIVTEKLFKKYTGISFVKYLAYVRIRASLEALLEGKDSIEQIAADCGMPNSKSYTAALNYTALYPVTIARNSHKTLK